MMACHLQKPRPQLFRELKDALLLSGRKFSRSESKEECRLSHQDLETQTKVGNEVAQDQTLELRAALHRDKIIDCQNLRLFLRYWWVDKMDMPVKEMYKLLKHNMPLILFHYWNNLMAPKPRMRRITCYWPSTILKLSSVRTQQLPPKRTYIGNHLRCKGENCPQSLAAQLEEDLSVQKIERSIESLKAHLKSKSWWSTCWILIFSSLQVHSLCASTQGMGGIS